MFNVFFFNKHKSKKVAEAQAAATEPAEATEQAEAAPVEATAQAEEAPVEATAAPVDTTAQTASIIE